MIEKYDNDTIVRNYTSGFDIKEYIQTVLVPQAFPDIEMNKLNLGLTGITSEMIAQAVEDAHATASLMINESFISKATLPSSIYSAAALYDLGYTFATPSKCHFALQLWIPDIIEYSTCVKNSSTKRFYLDKNTRLNLGDNSYRLDYDIIIDHQFVDGQRVYNVYYNIDESNSISDITNKYIKHQVSSINWLVLFVELNEFARKVEINTIADNLVTKNSDISLKWSNQIAGIDLVYISPTGTRTPMKLKTEYTNAISEPFAWYRFESDNQIVLSFSSNEKYFVPEFNSKIESTIYTCRGASANFDSYNRKAGIPVQKTGENYSYNSNTKISALCYGGSTGGLDKGDIELLRNDVILAANSANVITTDHDFDLWFQRYGQRYGTKSKFFKRRDDPTGTLFSQFIAIIDNTYIYPTNTLTIHVNQNQFDFINTDDNGNPQEFIIKPGHVWEYNDNKNNISRDTVRMIDTGSGPAMITDDMLPSVGDNRPFMFVNPFYIKIYKDPNVSANYNCLVDYTGWPEDVPIETSSFYQFQLATLSIERTMSKKYNNKYRIQVICVPVVTTDTTMKYVEGVGDEYPIRDNNLRMVLITRTAADGETGYIEMYPTEIREGGSIVFETEIAVYDNIRSDMLLEVDLNNTDGMKSLLSTGPKEGKVYIDAVETSFHFLCLMKDFSNTSTTNLFGNIEYSGYIIANRFANKHRDLTLYKTMQMMRSVISFNEEDNNTYTIESSLTPFIKYDIALDDDRMKYFIRAYTDQYAAMEPILSKLNGNTSIDFKLYNTYGRSSNYYIGPMDGDDVLQNSTILLDNVYVNIKFRMNVYDRTMWSQTVESVVTEIKGFFESLNNEERQDIHVSDLIHLIMEDQPNVRYIRFLGFNDYDANKQSIFVKFSDISELKEDQLHIHVPEMIRVDSNSIDIIEEV